MFNLRQVPERGTWSLYKLRIRNQFTELNKSLIPKQTISNVNETKWEVFNENDRIGFDYKIDFLL